MNDLHDLLRSIYLRVEEAVRRALEETGLAMGEYNMMIALDREGRVPITHLARRMLIDDSTATRVADALEARKFALRTEDPEDRRVRRLTLTPAGATLLARARGAVVQVMDGVMKPLLPAQRDVFEKALEAIASSGEGI